MLRSACDACAECEGNAITSAAARLAAAKRNPPALEVSSLCIATSRDLAWRPSNLEHYACNQADPGGARQLPVRHASSFPGMSRTGFAALVLANLFVAVQALWHEWSYYETMLIYWGEVVILGGYNVLRLMVVGVFGAAPLGRWLSRWVDLGSPLNRFLYTAVGVGFFLIKFGAFALVIGLFVLLLPAILRPEGEGGARTVHHALMAAGPGLLMAMGALCVSHGISFVRNFLIGREYDRLNILSL